MSEIMENSLEEQDILNTFYQMKEKIADMKANMDTLLRADLGPELTFQSQKTYLESIFTFMTPFLSIPADSLPIEHIRKISVAFLPVFEVLRKIKSFKIGINPAEEKLQLVSELHRKYPEAVETLLPYFAYAQSLQLSNALEELRKKNLESTNAINNQLDNIISEAKSAAEKHESLINSSLTNAAISLTSISNISKEAKDCLESIKKISAESVASHYNGLFEKEVEKTLTRSRWWLGGVILSLAVIGYLGIFNPFWSWKYDPTDPHQLYKLLGSKISVMAALFFFLYWCAKNYMVLQHNITINRHRQNALGTFEAFVKSAENQDVTVKNALLLQAAQCIFNQQSSGYCGPHAEPDNKLLEILAKAASSVKKD